MKKFDAKTLEKENQFYGSSALLDMFQQMPKLGTSPSKSTIHQYLNSAYKECNTEAKKELFYSIIFMLGDISNREHNLFKEKSLKVENGGNSQRKVFFYCLEWMLTYNTNTKKQFYEFMSAIIEYTNIENLFFYQLRTDRNKGSILEEMKLPVDIEQVTDYIASIISNSKTTEATHQLWAKFLPRPDFAKRKRTQVILEGREKSMSEKLGKKVNVGDTYTKKSSLQPQTILKEQFEFELIYSLSKKMGWEIKKHTKNIQFIGFLDYKKKYLANSEAKLFSQKGILNFDKSQFIKWLDSLPAGARYRVQRRLCNVENDNLVSTKKWINKDNQDLFDWYISWQKSKVKAQEKLLSLTDEDKKNMSKESLQKIEKAAKVNVSGDTLVSVLSKAIKNNLSSEETKIVSQSVFDKIKCEVPVLIYADISGSMGSSSVNIDGVNFRAIDMVHIALTAFLLKNPRPELGNIFGVFSNESQILTDYSFEKRVPGTNRYMWGSNNTVVKNELLIDRSKHFIDNMNRIKEILSAYSMGSTNIVDVSIKLKQWVDSDPKLSNQRKEIIQQYPVHLYISDGDFNGYGSAKDTIMKHRQNMKQWFSWDGVIVIWDVKHENRGDGNKLEGVPNTMYFGSANFGVLNQIFTNIHDLDIIDSYAPLLALHRSERYQPVRELVTDGRKKTKSSVIV